MNSSLPDGFWGFAWAPCARVGDSSWPDAATYWRGSRFQESSELWLLEIFPWLCEPGLDTFDHLEDFGPQHQYLSHTHFSFHFLSFFKKILVHLRYVFIALLSTHFKSGMPEGCKENYPKKSWHTLCGYTWLFSVPWWCSINSFGRNKSGNFLLTHTVHDRVFLSNFSGTLEK